MNERLRLGAAAMLVGALAGTLLLAVGGEKSPTTDSEPAVDAAREALAAWGRFAVSGDLSPLDGLFDKEGPQYRQLQGEAPTLAADPAGLPPYLFVLTEESIAEEEDGLLISGMVTVSRPGEQDQVFEWSVEMRLRDDRWLLWTVRTK